MKQCDSTSVRVPIGRRMPGIARALMMALCLSVFSCGLALADDELDTSAFKEAGVGVASGAVTIPYLASKLLYAGVGGIVGGVSWVLSGGNSETAESIWNSSLNGTYVITPEHLRGHEPVRFMGSDSPEDDE